MTELDETLLLIALAKKKRLLHDIANVGVVGKNLHQGEIVNILLKIKNSFLPTKQILIGL
ncbi:hypothetical protein ACH48_14390 [Aeromonas caviae]|nr:hypothetical protein ACH48_14390 [Aeromonas caviae]